MMTWVIVRNEDGEELATEVECPNPMVGDYLEEMDAYIVHVMEDDDDDIMALDLLDDEEEEY